MDLSISDFNDAGPVISRRFNAQWAVLAEVLQRMPLHLKASDQKGKQGKLIWDPVGTNSHIKNALEPLGWGVGLPIASEYSFLGTSIDFGLRGLLVEVQFSNYPFLLNNLVRSEIFFRAGDKVLFGGHSIGAAVIITKLRIFPASNSTLYYEQARDQLTALAGLNIFSVPIRLIGLGATANTTVAAVKTTYHTARYSRTTKDIKKEVFTLTQQGQGRGTLSQIKKR